MIIVTQIDLWIPHQQIIKDKNLQIALNFGEKKRPEIQTRLVDYNLSFRFSLLFDWLIDKEDNRLSPVNQLISYSHNFGYNFFANLKVSLALPPLYLWLLGKKNFVKMSNLITYKHESSMFPPFSVPYTRTHTHTHRLWNVNHCIPVYQQFVCFDKQLHLSTRRRRRRRRNLKLSLLSCLW